MTGRDWLDLDGIGVIEVYKKIIIVNQNNQDEVLAEEGAKSGERRIELQEYLHISWASGEAIITTAQVPGVPIRSIGGGRIIRFTDGC